MSAPTALHCPHQFPPDLEGEAEVFKAERCCRVVLTKQNLKLQCLSLVLLCHHYLNLPALFVPTGNTAKVNYRHHTSAGTTKRLSTLLCKQHQGKSPELSSAAGKQQAGSLQTSPLGSPTGCTESENSLFHFSPAIKELMQLSLQSIRASTIALKGFGLVPESASSFSVILKCLCLPSVRAGCAS